MFGRTGQLYYKIFRIVLAFTPVSLLYLPSFSRKVIYRIGYVCLISSVIGYFKQPAVLRAIIRQAESQKKQQELTVTEMLSSIDLQLGSYSQNYFVIVAAETKLQENPQQMQRTVFELNSQINKKLQINENYFSDVKFLFVGQQQIYDPLAQNTTLIEFYNRQSENSRKKPAIYVLARQSDGTEHMLNSIPLKADLASILKLISKHRARVFAASLQF